MDSALRVAVGQVSADRGREFQGGVVCAEPLSPLASTTQDPAVSTNFLAHCAYVKVMAGEYEKGLELVTSVLGTSEKLRLTFALPQSLFLKAQAEIGLRRLDDADATIQRLQRPILDPYTEIINLHLRLRLELASGSLIDWGLYDETSQPQIQRVSVAEFLSIAALWLAAAGNPSVRAVYRPEPIHLFKCRRSIQQISQTSLPPFAGRPDARSRLRPSLGRLLKNGAADAFVTAYESGRRYS